METRKSKTARRRFLPTPRDRLIIGAVRTHGRLTASNVRRLFFRDEFGTLASVQTVNGRLRRLVDAGYLSVLVIDLGRGSGPYAYGIGLAARALFGRSGFALRRGVAGPVWHDLEIAEFRVQLELALTDRGGALLEWVGEPALRSLLKGRTAWPVPDALVHWRLARQEGTFFLEWDRGSESVAVLVAKLGRYGAYTRERGHHVLLPGLGLRPRLAIVVNESRKARLITYLSGRRNAPPLTVAIGAQAVVVADPLSPAWWRSDLGAPGSLFR